MRCSAMLRNYLGAVLAKTNNYLRQLYSSNDFSPCLWGGRKFIGRKWWPLNQWHSYSMEYIKCPFNWKCVQPWSIIPTHLVLKAIAISKWSQSNYHKTHMPHTVYEFFVSFARYADRFLFYFLFIFITFHTFSPFRIPLGVGMAVHWFCKAITDKMWSICVFFSN